MRGNLHNYLRTLCNNLVVQEKGITLLETLVAMAILGMVAVVFLTGLAISSKVILLNQDRVAAESLAKSQLEDIKARSYVMEATSYPVMTIPQDLVDRGYDITVSAEPLHAPDDGMQKITVAVDKNGEVLFTLIGYKVVLNQSG